jgi:hypothetical protein
LNGTATSFYAYNVLEADWLPGLDDGATGSGQNFTPNLPSVGTTMETYDAFATDGDKGIISMNVIITTEFTGANFDITLTYNDTLLTLKINSDQLDLLCYYYDITAASVGVLPDKKPASCSLDKTNKKIKFTPAATFTIAPGSV